MSKPKPEYVEALKREREMYAQSKQKDRLAMVDAELDRLGVERDEKNDDAPEKAVADDEPERAVRAQPRARKAAAADDKAK